LQRVILVSLGKSALNGSDYLGLVAFSAHNWKDAIVDGERAASLAGRPPAAYVETAQGQLGAAPPVGDYAATGGPVNR
jgi:hypothetical protein